MKNLLSIVPAIAGLGLGVVPAFASTSVQFDLLTWGDGQATVQLPSAKGLKPSAALPNTGDWLIFNGDDATNQSNPQGSLSHNFADLSGQGGAAGYNMAPSLTGSITLDFNPSNPNAWDVSVTDLTYSGQATSMIFMNQHLITPGSPATQTPSYLVDGIGNAGTWSSDTAGGWAIQYNMDFYFDANISPDAIDVTFDNTQNNGYLLPVSLLTTQGLANLTLDDPANLYGGDFENYLLTQIAPRLPGDATYLLITQMNKTHPGYASSGMPLGISGLVGNTTFAYTTSAIPEPAGLALLGLGGMFLLKRRSN
ncbi:MAG: PEP-CTERM sorting domain-containing protein [Phycisphaerales bacterium]|nr:PEP-CTERM sorting domain-containing protein [Phycisphaerales bacterium]